MAKGVYTKEEALVMGFPALSDLEAFGKVIVCGSVRRECETVGDLDVVFQPLVGSPIGYYYWNSTLPSGWHRMLTSYSDGFRLQHDCGFQIDVFLAEEYNIGTITVKATGSARFNKHLEAAFGEEVWKTPAVTEDEFFSKLNLPYIQPMERSYASPTHGYVGLMYRRAGKDVPRPSVLDSP